MHEQCNSKTLREPANITAVHSKRWGGEVACLRFRLFIGMLRGWALQAHPEIGHCRERLGIAGNLWGTLWHCRQGLWGRGHGRNVGLSCCETLAHCNDTRSSGTAGIRYIYSAAGHCRNTRGLDIARRAWRTYTSKSEDHTVRVENNYWFKARST